MARGLINATMLPPSAPPPPADAWRLVSGAWSMALDSENPKIKAAAAYSEVNATISKVNETTS